MHGVITDNMHTAGLAFIVSGISTMPLGEGCLLHPQACRVLIAGHEYCQQVYAYYEARHHLGRIDGDGAMAM